MNIRKSRLWKNVGGSASVEFAIIALPLLIFVFGIIEFALVSLAKNHLETTVMTAARAAKTGAKNANGESGAPGDRLNYVNEVTDAVGGKLFNKTRIGRNSQVLADWTGTEPTCNPGDANGAGVSTLTTTGNANNIVAYTYCYRWPVFTPLIQGFFGGTTVILTASSVVQNENF